MDNLFTPEVIEQFLQLLTTAADGGVKAVILWLVLPTVAILITALAWLYGLYLVVRGLATTYTKHCETKLQLERAKIEQPTVLSLKGILVNEEAEGALHGLLNCIRSGAYVHASDIVKVQRAYERSKAAK